MWMQLHFRPGCSEVEQKVLPVLREPSGLCEKHILKQLAETLMQTNKGYVVTTHASDRCQYYERQTVDGVLWTHPRCRGPIAHLLCIVFFCVFFPRPASVFMSGLKINCSWSTAGCKRLSQQTKDCHHCGFRWSPWCLTPSHWSLFLFTYNMTRTTCWSLGNRDIYCVI